MKQHNHIIELKNLSCFYTKHKKITEDVSMGIDQGKFISIIGPNGAGKTSLIKAIVGLIKYEGSIELKGKDIKSYKHREIAKIISYVPQHFPSIEDVTVRDFIAFARHPYNRGFLESKEDKDAINGAIKALDLELIADKNVDELSGGQKQKVLLASVIAQDTEIIILDEPTTYLDLFNQYETLETIHNFHQNGKTIIAVVHDINHARKFSDIIIAMKNGKIHSCGGVRQVLTSTKIKSIFGVNAKFNKNFLVDVDILKKKEGKNAY